MNETRMPECKCPTCSYKLDAATMLGGNRRPAPGDVSVCVNCAAVNLYAEDLTVRSPTPGELRRLRASNSWPTIQRAVRAIFSVRRKKT